MALVAAVAAQAFSSASGSTPDAERGSPAWVAANANKARAKTSPSFINEPDYVRPEAARLAGEFGEVVISGIIGEDGKVREPKIKVSSRSSSIDSAALASIPAMLFEPARDAEGNPLSIPADLALEFGHVDFRGPRGLSQYRCEQFVRDYDWWYRTWPADAQDRIFKTLRGYVALSGMQSGKPAGDFDSEWKATIEACRKSPGRLMLDMLKPDGAFIRGMLKKGS
jgi:TonB family protein